MHSVSETGTSSVPAFLTKIWTLVEDPETDELISWDPSGMSFRVHDQARFAKEILPHYFKHSNIASFIRQLNMYGFRKVVHVDSGSIRRDTDEVEFHHPYFIRGQESLLEHIKRKSNQPSGNTTTLKTEAGLKFNHDDVKRVLNDVQLMKGKQEAFTMKMDKMKKENEALWREVASLRQKHVKQQQIVNKLIQFMIHLVGGNRNPLSGSGLSKRKMPLMISDSSQVTTAKRPRYTKQLSIEEVTDPPIDYVINTPGSLEEINADDIPYKSGPIIHEVTDTASSSSSLPISATQTKPVTVKNTASTRLPTQSAADLLLPSATDLQTDLNSSLNSTDLNDLVDNMDSSLLDVGNTDDTTITTTGGAGALDVLDRNQLNSQLDTLQLEIDSLKDMMTSAEFNFDPSSILPMFNVDSTVPASVENLLGDLDTPVLQVPPQTPPPSTSSTVLGNELVQYQTPSELGIPDLSDIITVDGLDNTEEEEAENEPIDPMSFINLLPDTGKLKMPEQKDG